MSTLFVTGSGTDVGKTFVTCRLLETLPDELRLRCLKPVVTGFDPELAGESDPGRLLAARGLASDLASIAAISPWQFRAPLSADMAAEREGRVIPFDDLVEFCRPRPGIALTLIEGIGGLMAPIDDRHTVLDWIAALDCPALLVVGSYLGSLSHTLTAVQSLRGRGLELLAVVVSQSTDEPVAMTETLRTLRRFLDGVPLVAMPRDGERLAADAGELAGDTGALPRDGKEPPGDGAEGIAALRDRVLALLRNP
jgi:dethiobiotin synthetase